MGRELIMWLAEHDQDIVGRGTVRFHVCNIQRKELNSYVQTIKNRYHVFLTSRRLKT